MKKTLFILFICISAYTRAQRIENIYVNLYTDSLKKGTYNYINVDGLLSNGKYQPLDSTEIIFTSSYGKFYGNNLWIDHNCTAEKIFIKVTLRNNGKINKDFVMYLKKKEDDEKLPTTEEIIDHLKNPKKKKGS